MTQVQIDIRDSLGVALAGYVRVELDYDLEDNTTAFLSVPVNVPLVNGQATIELEPSEAARVSYGFTVYKTGTPDTIVKETFHATIPDSATPIKFVDLVPTGITQAALDTSISAISRRLYNDDVFWSRFQDELIQLRGDYSPSAWYQRGNQVLFQGGSYVYINRIAATGIAPVAGQQSAYWLPMALPGQTVVGALDPAVLNLKADKTYVDSQLNSKVGANGASLTNATIADTLPLNSNNNRIAYASWVQSVVAPVAAKTVPVGSLLPYAGTSAPTGWVFCDGRVLVRANFADLFAIVGTQFATGGEVGTDFRLPDLRGRLPLGGDAFSGGSAANRVPGAAIASSGGSASMTLTTGHLPSHSHTTSVGVFNTQTGGISVQTAAGSTHSTSTVGTSSVGSGNAIDKMNPYLAFNWIIFHGVV